MEKCTQNFGCPWCQSNMQPLNYLLEEALVAEAQKKKKKEKKAEYLEKTLIRPLGIYIRDALFIRLYNKRMVSENDPLV